jgi:benzoate/toluate 1,2-dioxygenase beta subunit
MSAALERQGDFDLVTPELPAQALRELEAFLFEEARCLDEKQFERWVELFDDDGIYWVPSEAGQSSPEGTLSIFYEDRPLLLMRARRLGHPQTLVQVPASRTHHHVGGVRASATGPEEYAVDSMLLMAEWRGGEQRLFSGRCSYRIRRTAAGLRIAFKRVDLLNCDAPHRAIAIPF